MLKNPMIKSFGSLAGMNPQSKKEKQKKKEKRKLKRVKGHSIAIGTTLI